MSDPLKRTLLILTFVTGILDAASFLALGQVFVAMQTGNVIFLGLGFAGASGAPTLAPLIALGAFLVGGLTAALLTPAVGRRSGDGLQLAMAIEIVLLTLAGTLAALVDVDPGKPIAYLLIAMLSVAMGLRNTVARGIGDPNLATTVLNLTLSAFTRTPTGLASEGELALRATAFAAILAGAVTGALLLKASLALAIAAAVVGVVVAAVTGREAVAEERVVS